MTQGQVVEALHQIDRPASLDEIGQQLGLPKQLRECLILGHLRTLKHNGIVQTYTLKAGSFYVLREKEEERGGGEDA